MPEEYDQALESDAKSSTTPGTVRVVDDISSEVKSEPVLPAARRESFEDLFRQRLQRIWSTTTQLAADGTDWRHFQAVAFRVTPRAALVFAAEASGTFAGTPIQGDSETVSLQVSAVAEELSNSPDDLRKYLSVSLAPTIERLELERRTPRDRIVGIINNALILLPSDENELEVAIDLVAYLQGQAERSELYYIALSVLAIFISSGDSDRYTHASAAASHGIITGMMQLADAQGTLDGERSGLILVPALNAMARAILRRAGGAREANDRVRAIVVDLLSLSSIFTTRSANESAEMVLDRLRLARRGVHDDDAAEVLAIVAEMGSSAEIWGLDTLELAQLEASSGVCAGATESADDVALRLNNSAISLSWLEPTNDDIVCSRLLLNALGVNWALAARASLYEALSLRGSGGIASIGRFASVSSDLASSSPLLPLVQPLVAVFLSLPTFAPPDDYETQGMTSRIAQSVAGMKLSQTTYPGDDGLRTQVREVIGQLLAFLTRDTSRMRSEIDWDDPLIGTATAVGTIFELLRDQGIVADGRLARLINDLVTDRRDPLTAVARRYGPFVEAGPLVASGLYDEREWSALIAELSRPTGSAGPILRNLTAGT